MSKLVLFPIGFVVCLIFLYSCGNVEESTYDANKTSALIRDLSHKEVLTEHDMEVIFTQFESMLECACEKAQSVLDSGYRRELVRVRLKTDAEFQNMCCQADSLDSIALQFAGNTVARHKYENRYREILLRYSSRMGKIGLY